MALVIIVAINCGIWRAFSTRPQSLLSYCYFDLSCAWPMLNILAVVAALWAGSIGRARWYWGGYFVAGFLAVTVLEIWNREILSVTFYDPLTSTRLLRWIQSFRRPIDEIVINLAIVVLALSVQLIVAVLGGWIACQLAPRVIENSDAKPRRFPLTAPLVAVLWMALCSLAIGGYLRWSVDAKEFRRAVGSEATINLQAQALIDTELRAQSPFEIKLAYNPELEALNGRRVRIDRDDQPCEVLEVPFSPSNTRVGLMRFLRREVQVTILDGDQAGQTTTVMHCFLRPVPRP
jgi:hypothetical protein